MKNDDVKHDDVKHDDVPSTSSAHSNHPNYGDGPQSAATGETVMAPRRRFKGGEEGQVSTDNIALLGSGGFTTVARQWGPAPGHAEIVIPANHHYYWSQVSGQWIWHPMQGPCGPEGQGGPGGEHFLIMNAPGGALCAMTSLGTYLRYLPEIGPAGDRVFVSGPAPLNLLFFCNDHNDPDMYADNSGEIYSTLTWYPAP